MQAKKAIKSAINENPEDFNKLLQQPSVRQVAFRLMVKVVKKHPDLASEIQFLAESHYLESLSEGIKCSVLKMIEELKEIRDQAE